MRVLAGVVAVGIAVAVAGGDAGARFGATQVEPGLRTELLAMMRQDQQERTGTGLPPGTKLPPAQDFARTERLKEIIARYGWPTRSLVGPDGGEAAWLIAQHSDFDVPFQQQALGLLEHAADHREASRGDVAYLGDRVAVNLGRPQRYGSQIRCRDGEPAPATPLVDPARVDSFRLAAGLDTLASYYGELAMMCAQEAAEGQQPLS